MNILKLGMFLASFSLQASTVGIGIGGGGAMSGISFDPYQSGHMYIGTDMGLVYESFDLGIHWKPLSQEQISYYVDLNHPSHMGYRSNGFLYWAAGGCNPKMSMDRGGTWVEMTALNNLLPKECLSENVRIKYWLFSKEDPRWIGVGTTNGLFLSNDDGATWKRLFQKQESFVSLKSGNALYHATSSGIFKLELPTFRVTQMLVQPLSNAAMGMDDAGITLVGLEKTEVPQKKVFIKKATDKEFTPQTLPVGRFVVMSPVNSSIIYFSGNANNQQGDSIWSSQDAGAHWNQIYENDEIAYRDGKINPNAVGISVGFWDSEYHDVQVSPTNPSMIGVSGDFFFKRSVDQGVLWKYPYSKTMDLNATIIDRKTFWQSTELNPVSVYVMKRHPMNSNLIVAGLADIGCVLSQDNGQNWRLCNIPSMNSLYDFEFSPTQPNRLYAAASTLHDYPEDWSGDINNGMLGGIFVSDDLGETWTRLSPDTPEFNTPYLSLAIDYKHVPCQIYAGTQGKGMVVSKDCGVNWQRLNQGFESEESSVNSSDQKGSLIFPKIKISPKTGDVYVLHTGNRLWTDENNPYLHFTGIYRLDKKEQTWKQLGRLAQVKAPEDGGLYWKYPIDFAVDWDHPENLYLVDMATAGTWKIGGLWYSPDEGTTWSQLQQFDSARRIILKGEQRYLLGWSDEPNTPFIYTAGKDNVFKPLNIRIPLQRVNDMLFDEKGYIFGTFGGGMFRYTN